MKKYLVLAIILLQFPWLASAQADNRVDNIKKIFSKQFPQLRIDNIEPAPIPGWYQVISGSLVVYTSEQGKYVFDGELLELKQAGAINLTENARRIQRVKVLAQLDAKDLIIYSPKKPKYTVTVFTDIDCAYCRKFHQQIDQILAKGVAVRYAAFPRGGLYSESFQKAVNVWCAEDRKQALTKAKSGKDLVKAECNNPVTKELHTGLALGINATPTIVFNDGSLQPGYLSADALSIQAKLHQQF